MRRPREWLIAFGLPALAALLFALLSLAMLPYPGLEDDEVLFSVPIYFPQGALFSVTKFGFRVPLMLMGYLGTLKTWLYATIFALAPPSRWSVRVPMVVVGVVTIWLTWVWTRRAAGTLAAAFTVALLSTDAVFILTNTFDWGPVALQHALLMGGLVAIQTWLHNDTNNRMLALAFFLWGLGMWDKALMIWPLIGLAVATLCVYPRQLRGHVRRATLLIAIVSLLAGALPLVYYNIKRHGDTASANTKLAAGEISGKLEELQGTVDGSILLETMVAIKPGPLAQSPASWNERLSVAVRTHLGAHPHNAMLPAIALSLACLVSLLRTPRFSLLVFILIAASVTWLQMASNAGTGGSAHHVILMWPFPCIFVGVALAAASQRAPKLLSHAIVGVVSLLVCANLLNTNEYLADLILNGAVGAWTDASYRLASAISPYRSGEIGIVDWGYLNGLRMTYQGELKLSAVNDLIHKPLMTEDDRAKLAETIASPNLVFIRHTDENQIFPGVNDRLRSTALAQGYTEQTIGAVDDNQARPVFEIFRFVKRS